MPSHRHEQQGLILINEAKRLLWNDHGMHANSSFSFLNITSHPSLVASCDEGGHLHSKPACDVKGEAGMALIGVHFSYTTTRKDSKQGTPVFPFAHRESDTAMSLGA